MFLNNPVPLNMHLRITTQNGSVTVEKMAGIFTKGIWQTLVTTYGYVRKSSCEIFHLATTHANVANSGRIVIAPYGICYFLKRWWHHWIISLL